MLITCVLVDPNDLGAFWTFCVTSFRQWQLVLFVTYFCEQVGMYKRKRSYSSQANALAVFRPYATPYKKAKRAPMVVPGRTRIGGYYGRYAYGGRRGELKFHDIAVDDGVVAVGGTIQNTGSVNLIAQGVTESERVGRKCTVKSISWRWRVNLPTQDAGALPITGDTVRMILYQDKQCNGATTATAEILEIDDWQSFLNLSNSQRFVIHCDKLITINYNSLASDGAGVVSSNAQRLNGVIYKKVNIPLEFSAAVGAITEIKSNNLGVLLVGEAGIAGFGSHMRLRFSDN